MTFLLCVEILYDKIYNKSRRKERNKTKMSLKYKTEFVIQDWCNEVGKSASIPRYRDSDDTLYIYTEYPGWFIGRAGSTFDKYKQQLNLLGWKEIKFVELKETFTPGKDYSDIVEERARAFWDLEGQYIVGENFENG